MVRLCCYYYTNKELISDGDKWSTVNQVDETRAETRKVFTLPWVVSLKEEGG